MNGVYLPLSAYHSVKRAVKRTRGPLQSAIAKLLLNQSGIWWDNTGPAGSRPRDFEQTGLNPWLRSTRCHFLVRGLTHESTIWTVP